LIKVLPKIKHTSIELDEGKRAINLYNHALENINKQLSKVKAMISSKNVCLRICSFFWIFSYQDYYNNLVTALNSLTAMQKQLQRLKKEETIDFSEVTIKDMVIIASWVERPHLWLESTTQWAVVFLGNPLKRFSFPTNLLDQMNEWQNYYSSGFFFFSQQNKKISPIYNNVKQLQEYSLYRKAGNPYFCIRQEQFKGHGKQKKRLISRGEELKLFQEKLTEYEKSEENKKLITDWFNQSDAIEPWQKELLRSNGIDEKDIYQQEVVLLKFPYDSLYQLNARGCYNPAKKSPYQFNDGTIKSKDNPFLDTNGKRRMVTIGDKQEKISFLPGQIASDATWAFKVHFDQLGKDHQAYLADKETS